MNDRPIRDVVREKLTDRLTDRAALVLLDALGLADYLGHRYVGTEHLLAACEGRGGVSADALKNLGVYGKIWPEVTRLLGLTEADQPPAPAAAARPPLFQAGEFTLRSGRKSAYKIECDAMTPADWAGVAAAIHEEGLLKPFGRVAGVPRGGIPFAEAMKKYTTDGCQTLLICEDVVTTGGSMERFYRALYHGDAAYGCDATIGVCFVARGKVPDWVTPFLQMGVKA